MTLAAAYEPPPFMLPAPLVIEVAGEPKGKGRPRFSRKSGAAYTPQPTRVYEDAIRFAAQHAMRGKPPIEGPLIVTVRAYFSVPASWSKAKREAALSGVHKHTGRPDADNLLKSIDALNAIVWRDDSQIYRAVIEKAYAERPRLRIEIEGRI